MNKAVKVVLMMALIFYIISPADFLPGPIDDAIAILVLLVSNRNKRIAQTN